MPKVKDEKKVTDIHKAAMKLLIQTGFAGLKMADVAKGANIATGTLYIYYKSKEALVNDVYEATRKEMIAVLLDSKNAMSGDFYKTFASMWLSYFNYCLRFPEKMIFVEQFVYSGLIDASIISETEKELKPLNQFIEYGQEKGIFKTLDVELLKAQMQGAIHETIKVIHKQQIPLTDPQILQCLGMSWDAMKRTF
ncbi:MAG: TetR/AcrR family transcriptional regulator [Bacteroidota bacterium]